MVGLTMVPAAVLASWQYVEQPIEFRPLVNFAAVAVLALPSSFIAVGMAVGFSGAIVIQMVKYWEPEGDEKYLFQEGLFHLEPEHPSV